MKIYPILLTIVLTSCSGLSDGTSSGTGSDSSSSSTTSCASATSSTDNAELALNTFKIGVTNQGDSLAQSIKFSAAKTVSAVAVKLQRLGSPSGTLTLTIEGDSSSAPDGSVKATKSMDIKDGSDFNISTTADFYTFTFTSSIALTANTTYWIKVTPSYTANLTDVIQWLGSTSDGYTNGKAAYKSTAGTWAEHTTTKELLFKVTCD